MRSRVLVLSCLVVLFSGCQSMREFLGFGYSHPRVSFKNLDVKSVSLDAIDLVVTLSVQNPNSFDIVLKRMDYNIVIAAEPIANGIYDKKLSILAEKETIAKLPVKVNKKNVISVLGKILENPSKEMIAVMSAKVIFDSPVGEIEHNFVDEKKIGGR